MGALKLDAEELFFTSDTHFGHAKIIEYGRKFKTVDEMDETLIRNWNSVVPKDGTVIHCGDFSFHKPKKTEEIRAALNGRIILIEGNHDIHLLDRYPELSLLFQGVHQLIELKVRERGVEDRQRISCCHYAMRIWNKSHQGAWQVYGHSHGSMQDNPSLVSMDVGTDVNDYKPLTYDQVKAHMSTRKWECIDHHGSRVGADGKVY